MALPVDVGQELLNVPFPEMVLKLALAIAQAQLELDMHSVDVATTLAATTLDPGTVVVAIEETVNEDGDVVSTTPIFNENELSLLAFGLNPTFYQFADTVIEVKMEITMRMQREFEFNTATSFKVKNRFNVKGGASTSGLASFLFGKASTQFENTTTTTFSTSINARYKNKFSVEAHGTSLLRTTLRPVPPPERSVPRVRVLEESE